MHCHIKFYIFVLRHYDFLHSLCQVTVWSHKPSPPYSEMLQSLIGVAHCHKQEYEFQSPQATSETLIPLKFASSQWKHQLLC